jgi:hypothetical protein
VELPYTVERQLTSRFDCWLDLEDFWRRHACYVAVCGLWEAVNDPMHGDLRGAVARYAERLPGLAAIGHPTDTFDNCYPFLDSKGVLSDEPEVGGISLGRDESSPALAGYVTSDIPSLGLWADTAPVSSLAWFALQLIEENVNAGCDDVRVQWRIHGTAFGQPVAEAGYSGASLWGLLWHLLALDIRGGLGWRMCPHCGRIFYPPRVDRFFCTPEQQRLASKREWWSRNRAGGEAAGRAGTGERGAPDKPNRADREYKMAPKKKAASDPLPPNPGRKRRRKGTEARE